MALNGLFSADVTVHYNVHKQKPTNKYPCIYYTAVLAHTVITTIIIRIHVMKII